MTTYPGLLVDRYELLIEELVFFKKLTKYAFLTFILVVSLWFLGQSLTYFGEVCIWVLVAGSIAGLANLLFDRIIASYESHFDSYIASLIDTIRTKIGAGATISGVGIASYRGSFTNSLTGRTTHWFFAVADKGRYIKLSTLDTVLRVRAVP